MYGFILFCAALAGVPGTVLTRIYIDSQSLLTTVHLFHFQINYKKSIGVDKKR